MNKVVIMFFLIVIGAVLIGIPLYGFFNPQLQAQFRTNTQNVSADVDPAAHTSTYANTTWAVSHNVMLNNEYGQQVPAVFDLEMALLPEGKLRFKAQLFIDGGIPARYAQLFAEASAGWEGTWKIEGNGTVLEFRVKNPFDRYPELNKYSPFPFPHFRVKGGELEYTPDSTTHYIMSRMM